jgi:hypothetical protein
MIRIVAPQRGAVHVTRLRSWWGGLSRRAKIIVSVVVAVLVLAAIGSVGKSPATGSEATASPSTPVAVASVGASVIEVPSAEPSTGATSEPTPVPTAEPTPEPTPVPTPVPSILKTSGKGDKIVKMAAQDGPTWAKITNKGGDNFAVVSYTGGTYGDLLVNEIGSYAGQVYIATGIDRLKVTSSGTWTIEVRPITTAKHWNGEAPLAGKGDAVINLVGWPSGITTITNKSKSNFAVIAYSEDGGYLDLLVNDIGNYSGEVLLPDADPIVLAIHAVGGTWSFSTVQQ